MTAQEFLDKMLGFAAAKYDEDGWALESCKNCLGIEVWIRDQYPEDLPYFKSTCAGIEYFDPPCQKIVQLAIKFGVEGFGKTRLKGTERKYQDFKSKGSFSGG